ncbi:hypothetical protein P4B35_05495 [Pontiellaceae bacterium B12227]|nr:hypothetical protein [Pontiellaceae bacterium B12227]
MVKEITTVLAVLCVSSALASTEIIAGWENWSHNQAGEATRTSGARASYTGSNWSISQTGVSSDGSFGNFLTEPAADTTNENNDDGGRLPNGLEGDLIFSITDTTGMDRELGFFHFDSGSLRKKSSRHWKLEVLSGDLTVGTVANGTVPEPAVGGTTDWFDYDVDLRGLADPVLDANGTVVFRLSFTGGIAGSSGHHQMLDNVGVSSSISEKSVPLGLITSSGIGLLFLGLGCMSGDKWDKRG